jgi:MbtH protein
MRNPFESDDTLYVVLSNAEGQYSLWPDGEAVPAGWTTCHGPADRSDCVAFVDAEWTDMRPLSVREVAAR